MMSVCLWLQQQSYVIKYHLYDVGKPRGYAFIEYEHKNNMKEAYKRADGKKVEGRRVVVDVERGRTVPNWSAPSSLLVHDVSVAIYSFGSCTMLVSPAQRHAAIRGRPTACKHRNM